MLQSSSKRADHYWVKNNVSFCVLGKIYFFYLTNILPYQPFTRIYWDVWYTGMCDTFRELRSHFCWSLVIWKLIPSHVYCVWIKIKIQFPHIGYHYIQLYYILLTLSMILADFFSIFAHYAHICIKMFLVSFYWNYKIILCHRDLIGDMIMSIFQKLVYLWKNTFLEF